jgi:hypothetical protein
MRRSWVRPPSAPPIHPSSSGAYKTNPLRASHFAGHLRDLRGETVFGRSRPRRADARVQRGLRVLADSALVASGIVASMSSRRCARTHPFRDPHWTVNRVGPRHLVVRSAERRVFTWILALERPGAPPSAVPLYAGGVGTLVTVDFVRARRRHGYRRIHTAAQPEP